MRVSSRTPEGQPTRCPICNAEVRVDPSLPIGDAPCPVCGSLLFVAGSKPSIRSLWRERRVQRRGIMRESVERGRMLKPGMRPLTILLVGPLASGVAVGIPFHCFGDGRLQTLAAALFAVAVMVPFFAGLAWAVSPTSCPKDIVRVFCGFHRSRQVLRAVVVTGLFFVLSCWLFHLNELLGPVGDWLLVGAFPVVLLGIWGVIFIDERMNRLRDLV